nr:DUF899 family protein [Paracoccus aminovorans]
MFGVSIFVRKRGAVFHSYSTYYRCMNAGSVPMPPMR